LYQKIRSHEKMRVAALCSGGKDSTFALWLAQKEKHVVDRILAMIPLREDSWMFHSSNIHLIDLFAKCVELPLTKIKTSGLKGEEIEDLRRAIKSLGVEGVISGAIASKYQKSVIDGICQELGLVHLAPLWGREPAELLREIVETGFEVIITSVAAYGFDESWLGRKIDRASIEDLMKLHERFKINVAGEGGEFETLVLDGPLFKRKIEVKKARRIWRGDRGYLLIEEASISERW